MPGIPFAFTFTVEVTGATGTGAILNVAYVGNNPVTPTNEIVHIFVPTAIDLVSLTAARGIDGDGESVVSVSWVVAAENNTLGYRVMRSTMADRASAAVVSTGVIAATGSGGSYLWIDTTPPAGRAYYWIEEIALDGTYVSDYGPAMASPVAGRLLFLPILQR